MGYWNGFFNEKRLLAFATGKFICAKCGAEMEFEDKWEERLLCPKCGFKVMTEHYGFDSDEEYEAQYPTLEELIERENKIQQYKEESAKKTEDN